MTNHKPSVLACVTFQFGCDRIINIAKLFAKKYDCNLRVLSVLKPTDNYALYSKQIQYLYDISKKSGADMTILFDSNPVTATAQFINDNNINRLITGIPDGENSFLVNLNKECPEIPITMVTKDNKIYNLELCPSFYI